MSFPKYDGVGCRGILFVEAFSSQHCRVAEQVIKTTMNQDVGIMKTAQRGLHQPGLKHLALSAEECRVINLHRNLDEWVGGVRS